MTEKIGESTSQKLQKTQYSMRVVISYQLGNLIGFMINQSFSQQQQDYYQTVVGLDATLFFIAMVIYTVFNMFNDPIIGYLCDISNKQTLKYGKRFPFILLGALPWSFVVIFLFSSPLVSEVGQGGTFLWLLLFLFLFDGLYSLMDVNRIALFPHKFRDDKERKLGGMWGAIFSVVGILLGVVIPVIIPELITGRVGWTIQGIILAVIAFICSLLMIPGIREPAELRELLMKKSEKRTPFLEGLKITLKDKNFMGFTLFVLSYSTTMGIMIGGFAWFVGDIIQETRLGQLVLIGYIIAVPITAPLWYKLSIKIGARKVLIIGTILLALMGTPLLFVPSGTIGLVVTLIVVTTAGLVDGALESMHLPLFSSIIDKSTLEYGDRREGVYRGVLMFFMRLGITIRVGLLWIVQIGFGYVPRVSTEFLPLLGLRLYMSVIPLIVILSGLTAFLKLYTISKEEADANLNKLEELDL